jgi:hypothetical protein
VKPIRLTKHAISYLDKRGFTEEEVIRAIRESEWIVGELGKLECRLNIEYNSIWNNKYYDIKQIRPIFVEEVDEIVVVTVYTYFFGNN